MNKLGIILGLIILIADLYWTATSYNVFSWLISGIIILIADLIWIFLDARSK